MAGPRATKAAPKGPPKYWAPGLDSVPQGNTFGVSLEPLFGGFRSGLMGLFSETLAVEIEHSPLEEHQLESCPAHALADEIRMGHCGKEE